MKRSFRQISMPVSMSLLVLALGAGCALLPKEGGSSSYSQRVPASDGAMVCTVDQEAHVFVPPGALAADTTITITPADPPAVARTYTLIGQGYEFGPSGTQFKSPATVTLHYDPAKLPAGTPPGRIGMLAVTDGKDLEVLPATVDVIAHSVSATTKHFTWFAPFVSTTGSGVASVQVGGPGGTPLFATATTTTPARVTLWLGPDGLIRTDKDPYAPTGPTSVSFRVDTLGAVPNGKLRVERTLEDPGGPGTPWDMIMGGAFVGLESASTDASGVLVYTLDGKALQKSVTDGVLAAPGYPSGRVHLRIYAPQPIDVYVSLALHPYVRL